MLSFSVSALIFLGTRLLCFADTVLRTSPVIATTLGLLASNFLTSAEAADVQVHTKFSFDISTHFFKTTTLEANINSSQSQDNTKQNELR